MKIGHRTIELFFAFLFLVLVGDGTNGTGLKHDGFPLVETNLSATEELIGEKIMELGGDWERPDRLEFVGFKGPKFSTRHFEYLSHLGSLKILTIDSVKFELAALSYVSSVESLEELTIRNCNFNGTGIELLANCKNLRILTLAGIEFSEEGSKGLSKLTGLKHLEFEDAMVAPELFESLHGFKNLKTCDIVATNKIDESHVNALKKALPNCEFRVWFDVPKATEKADVK